MSERIRNAPHASGDEHPSYQKKIERDDIEIKFAFYAAVVVLVLQYGGEIARWDHRWPL